MNNILKVQNRGSFYPVAKVIVYIIFTIHLIMGNEISVAEAVKVIGLVEIACFSLTFTIPNLLDTAQEMRASASRMQVMIFH